MDGQNVPVPMREVFAAMKEIIAVCQIGLIPVFNPYRYCWLQYKRCGAKAGYIPLALYNFKRWSLLCSPNRPQTFRDKDSEGRLIVLSWLTASDISSPHPTSIIRAITHRQDEECMMCTAAHEVKVIVILKYQAQVCSQIWNCFHFMLSHIFSCALNI